VYDIGHSVIEGVEVFGREGEHLVVLVMYFMHFVQALEGVKGAVPPVEE
jgi:hypothetical protein